MPATARQLTISYSFKPAISECTIDISKEVEWSIEKIFNNNGNKDSPEYICLFHWNCWLVKETRIAELYYAENIQHAKSFITSKNSIKIQERHYKKKLTWA